MAVLKLEARRNDGAKTETYTIIDPRARIVVMGIDMNAHKQNIHVDTRTNPSTQGVISARASLFPYENTTVVVRFQPEEQTVNCSGFEGNNWPSPLKAQGNAPFKKKKPLQWKLSKWKLTANPETDGFTAEHKKKPPALIRIGKTEKGPFLGNISRRTIDIVGEGMTLRTIQEPTTTEIKAGIVGWAVSSVESNLGPYELGEPMVEIIGRFELPFMSVAARSTIMPDGQEASSMIAWKNPPLDNTFPAPVVAMSRTGEEVVVSVYPPETSLVCEVGHDFDTLAGQPWSRVIISRREVAIDGTTIQQPLTFPIDSAPSVRNSNKKGFALPMLGLGVLGFQFCPRKGGNKGFELAYIGHVNSDNPPPAYPFQIALTPDRMGIGSSFASQVMLKNSDR